MYNNNVYVNGIGFIYIKNKCWPYAIHIVHDKCTNRSSVQYPWNPSISYPVYVYLDENWNSSVKRSSRTLCPCTMKRDFRERLYPNTFSSTGEIVITTLNYRTYLLLVKGKMFNIFTLKPLVVENSRLVLRYHCFYLSTIRVAVVIITLTFIVSQYVYFIQGVHSSSLNLKF